MQTTPQDEPKETNEKSDAVEAVLVDPYLDSVLASLFSCLIHMMGIVAVPAVGQVSALITRSGELATCLGVLSTDGLYKGVRQFSDDIDTLVRELFDQETLELTASRLTSRLSNGTWDWSFLMSDVQSGILWSRMINALTWYREVSEACFLQMQNLLVHASTGPQGSELMMEKYAALECALMHIVTAPLKYTVRDILLAIPDAIDMMPNCVQDVYDELLVDPDYGLTLGVYAVNLDEMQGWERRDDLLVASALGTQVRKLKSNTPRDVEAFLGCISRKVDLAASYRRNRSADLMNKSQSYFDSE